MLWAGLDAWFVADDFWYVVYVEQVKSPWSSFLFPQFGNLCFKPITFVTSFCLDRALSMSPWSIHVSSLFFHLVNVVLVFFLVAAAFRRADEMQARAVEKRPGEEDKTAAFRDPVYPALAAAFVFAVHPVAALTACWYSCRADLLGTMFSLAALICVAAPEKPDKRMLVLSGALALFAMLSKAPYMTVFISAFVLRVFIEPETKWKDKLKTGFLFALPLFNALLVYVCWRLLVLGSFGGYVPLSEAAYDMLQQAQFHLPLVIKRVFRDFLVHHLAGEHPYTMVLAFAGGALVAAGGIGTLLRGKRVFLFGVLFSLVSVIPLWNLSHMLVHRENRLLYLALAGFAIVVAAVVHGPRNRIVRVLCLAAVLCACTVYGLYSRDKLEQWKMDSERNLEITEKIAGFLERKTPQASGDRVYVLGLSSEHYYLDAMVKTELSLSFQDKLIMSGEHPVFLYMSKDLIERIPEPKNLPPDSLPEYETHPADPTMLFMTAKPPDPLAAVHYDKSARVIEFKGNKVADLTAELRKRFRLRRSLHRRGRLVPSKLPSFGFKKTPMGLTWEVSGHVKVQTPSRLGEPYQLYAPEGGAALTSPPVSFHALSAAKAVLKMRTAEREYLPPGQDKGCLRWRGKDTREFPAENKACFALKPDGKDHVYEIDLDDNLHWSMTDTVSRLRLEPVYYRSCVELYRLEFLPAKKE